MGQLDQCEPLPLINADHADGEVRLVALPADESLLDSEEMLPVVDVPDGDGPLGFTHPGADLADDLGHVRLLRVSVVDLRTVSKRGDARKSVARYRHSGRGS